MVDGRLALAGRSRAGGAITVAAVDILLAVTAGVCGAGAGASAIVIPIAGAFVLVLGACATDRPLACAVLACTGTGCWAARGRHPPEQRVFLRRQVRQAELILRRFA